MLMEGEESRIAEENFFKIKILQNINSYDETEKLMARSSKSSYKIINGNLM